MAILSKIRQRSFLAIGLIGFALLAFVVSDLIQKGQFNKGSKYVGEINGKEISFDEFRVKVANTEKGGQGITAIQAANKVWDQEINMNLINTEYEKIGIRVGENHLIDNLKADPNIGQNPQFLNALGKFDIKKFKEFFKSNPEQAKMFADREKDANFNSKAVIYSTLVKGGMYTTTADGKFGYELTNNKVNIDYVSVLYSTIKDGDVNITDADITDYMKKNEKRFKAEETREIEYVLVEDKPSVQDENEVKQKISALLVGGAVRFNKETGKNDTLPSFKNATNIGEFVGENSDKSYDSTYVTKQDLPAEHAEKLYNLPAGEVYGPYLDGKYYSISKVIGRKAGAKTKASQILIGWEGSQAQNQKEKRNKVQAMAKAQSILAQAQANPTSFMMLAFTNSEDQSAQSGGDMGYIQKGQIPVKEFDNFLFSNGIGKFGIVETAYGYHVVSITDKQDGMRLATIAQKIEPSEATSSEVYAKATKFEMDALAGKDFAVLAKSSNLTVAPSVKAKVMDEAFGAIGNQRQIIKWAFESDTDVNAIKRFEVVNVGNVIAKLKKVLPKGLMAIEDAKPMVETLLKNKKKAERISAKMKGSSLEVIAKANATTVQNTPVSSVENAVLGTAGNEPKVVGTAIGLGVNKVSAPIEGNSGVYVVKAKAITKAPKPVNYNDNIAKLKSQAAQSVGRIISALKEGATIEDNRKDFY